MFNQLWLEGCFRRLGLAEGDRVVVHSSMRAVGRVDGGAADVVNALLEVIGPDGLLVAPVFTFGAANPDLSTEPSVTGLISETIRAWPGAVRSWHPAHSVAAVGPGAAELCAGHQHRGGLSVDSPLHRLAMQGGKVMLIGVGQNRNSTIHAGEAHANVPYLRVSYRIDAPNALPMTVDGRTLMAPMDEVPGCSEAFGAVEGALRRRGLIRDGAIGHAATQLMSGRALIETVVDLLAEDPAALLCTSVECYHCSTSRELLGRTV